MDKLITFAVPCYNSAEYMDHCISTLLSVGEDAEIILVDDGSTKDSTPEICDRYAEKYPNIVKVIHQENGGHGEGVNQGLRNATGMYYKVVDSDDWLDTDALQKVMVKLKELSEQKLDMMVCNYVYEHVEDNTQHTMHLRNVFPENVVFTWDDIKGFSVSQCLLMHSVIYRTEMLRKCGVTLPKHTFYVDNIFVFTPLPYVKSIYYMDVDLYRYFIGREDQSVNESIMASRIDQQLRVTKAMIDAHKIEDVYAVSKKLGKYMKKYLAMMMTISGIFCELCDYEDKDEKRKDLWQYLRNKDEKLYKHIRWHCIWSFACLQSYPGRKLGIILYRIARKIYKFN
ncbi:MAG: glycosyltransferase family 2 protein [Ruminococcus sp.]|nr:glycosyltransferase family 2 protein [Ruminococcus sp.]